MIKLLDLSLLSGDQANTDELTYSISIVESIEWSSVPIAKSHRLKRWRRSSSHSPGQAEIAGNFVRFIHHTRKVFLTEVCSVRGMKLLTRPSSRPDSECSSDEVQEFLVVSTSNSLTRVSTCQSWIVAEDHTNNIKEASLVICLPGTKFSFPQLLPPKPVSVVTDTLLEVEAEDSEAEKPSAKRAWSSSTTRPIASVSQSIYNTDRLSIIRDYLGCICVDVQFEEAKDEIRSYLRAKLERSCRAKTLFKYLIVINVICVN